jgi:hypothetical protein
LHTHTSKTIGMSIGTYRRPMPLGSRSIFTNCLSTDQCVCSSIV